MDSPHKMHEGQPEPSPDGSVVTPAPLPMSSDPHLFINRELSWLEFNRRVLEEAEDPANPLLERVRFLSIFGTNLDEFFMIRVSGLRGQKLTGVVDTPPDGMTPDQQLAAIRAALLPMLERTTQCWRDTLLPALDAAGIHVLGYDDLKKKQRKLLRRHFKHEIFPVLTPLAFDPGHPFPHISNLSINLAVVLDDPVRGEIFARLKVPQTLPRLLRIPGEESAEDFEGLHLDEVTEANFVWLEEVIRANLDLLFPGLPVREAFFFRVTRDADLEIEEDEASDLLIAMAEVVEQRRFGSAVRLQVDRAMPQEVRHILLEKLDLKPYQVYVHESLMGLADLNAITRLDRPSLKFPSFQPATHPQLGPDEDLFGAIRKAPIALYHPYDSFSPVVSFINQAAQDPDVIAIKQTLYRVDQKSPIVAALMEARENGKQVAALVELKARFDEENNIVWARALEEVGVHVVYGLVGLKTHAKMTLIVRKERAGIRRYVHLSTGNYNPVTARVYGDMGYFTCNEDIASDVSDLFNALTGYSRQQTYRKLLVAPGVMREELLRLIDREIARHRSHGDGHIALKMNGLVDEACIRALYRASQAGVRVDLQPRSICCLRPGLEGVSDTIRVTSVVGRFLEHVRMYYFHNGGQATLLMGSADLMPRNLDHRVEVLFPVEDPRLRDALRDDILLLHLRDTAKARELRPDGSWVRVQPSGDEPPMDTQAHLLSNGGRWRRTGDDPWPSSHS
jgi:polyphosphate kinase